MNRKIIFNVLIVLVILGTAYSLNHTGAAKAAFTSLDGLGPMKPVVFILFSILATIFFVPSVVINIAGGALFGLVSGIVISLLGAGLGSVSAFLTGRYLAKDWIARTFSGNKTYELIAEMAHREGWKIVAFARLSPVVPFLLANYFFGLTEIPAKNYFLASVLGSIPSTAVYVYLGTLSRDLAFGKAHERTGLEWFLFFAGLAVTVILSVYLKRLTDKSLKSPP